MKSSNSLQQRIDSALKKVAKLETEHLVEAEVLTLRLLDVQFKLLMRTQRKLASQSVSRN